MGFLSNTTTFSYIEASHTNLYWNLNNIIVKHFRFFCFSTQWRLIFIKQAAFKERTLPHFFTLTHTSRLSSGLMDFLSSILPRQVTATSQQRHQGSTEQKPDWQLWYWRCSTRGPNRTMTLELEAWDQGTAISRWSLVARGVILVECVECHAYTRGQTVWAVFRANWYGSVN